MPHQLLRPTNLNATEVAYGVDLQAVASLEGPVASTLFVMLTTLTSLSQLAAPQTCRQGRHLTVATARPQGQTSMHTVPLARCAAAALGANADDTRHAVIRPDLFPGEYLPHAIARRLDDHRPDGATLTIAELRRRALAAIASDPAIAAAGVTSYIGLNAARATCPAGRAAEDLLHQRVADRIDTLVAAAGFTF